MLSRTSSAVSLPVGSLYRLWFQRANAVCRITSGVQVEVVHHIVLEERFSMFIVRYRIHSVGRILVRGTDIDPSG